VALWNLPTAQFTHPVAPSAEKVPAAQLEQLDEDAPAWDLPAAQRAQALAAAPE